MSRKPETSVRKKIEALERRRTMLDVLIAFIKAHPHVANEGTLHALPGKMGLLYAEYALIRPYWKGSKVVLQLQKYGEDWHYANPEDLVFEGQDRMHRKVVTVILIWDLLCNYRATRVPDIPVIH